MKLDKLQRHTAYIILLHDAETKLKDHSYKYGICFLIKYLFRSIASNYAIRNSSDVIYYREEDNISIEKNLPELHKSLCSFNSSYLLIRIFPQTKDGWEKRIDILKQCIEETY